MLVRRLAAISLTLFALGACPGCGQGDGQVCQISSDCASGLVCTCMGSTGGSRGLCRSPSVTTCGNPVDAGPIDAAFVDAPAVDAANDDVGLDAPSSDDGAVDVGLDMSIDVGGSATDVGTDTNG